MSRNLQESERYIEPLPDEITRAPFNEGIAFRDTLAGMQTPKHGGQVPRFYRLYAWVSILFFCWYYAV
ncbi:hypothetical protein [Tumebacillus permanentifrigoris]|uniref:Uncharacterized protein n=1 Tax=Tumebacillus permanentifrigoris TaxID=378543 RepID=A0A316D6I3_9BACL|nr:hypothetical protein [Tumebacillus permanentifrigoris]PWK03937.1 hypothetical protein C7459_14010 [Tumebacillus permanentifrigoris]